MAPLLQSSCETQKDSQPAHQKRPIIRLRVKILRVKHVFILKFSKSSGNFQNSSGNFLKKH